jgi:hypothetical protein
LAADYPKSFNCGSAAGLFDKGAFHGVADVALVFAELATDNDAHLSAKLAPVCYARRSL